MTQHKYNVFKAIKMNEANLKNPNFYFANRLETDSSGTRQIHLRGSEFLSAAAEEILKDSARAIETV